MASTQMLKRRIRSVSNTKQITKAMELVAASKLRRVQEAATRSRIYSDAAIAILRRLSSSVEAQHHPYFRKSDAKGRLYIIFNSDSGLAGAYNTNIFNAAAKAFKEDKQNGFQPYVIGFGRKGARHFSRGANIELLGEYANIADDPEVNVFAPALETMTEGIKSGRFGAVDLIYTEPVSTMVSRVRVLKLLPIQPAAESEEKENEANVVFEFEPNPETVLESALKLYFESSLRRARVDAAASEHAMRMLSMNSANRNAGDLIDSLTLELNATRQADITQQIAEIVGGAEAIA